MLPELFKVGTKDIGISLILVGILPITLLVLFIASLFWAGAPDNPPDLNVLAQKISSPNVADLAFLIIVIIVLSLLFQPLQITFESMLEGEWYGFPFADLFRKIGIAWHTRQRNQLNKARRSDSVISLRTRFGTWLRSNVLRRPPSEQSVRTNKLNDEQEQKVRWAAWSLTRRYPSVKYLQPTALGNILEAIQESIYDKYGLDAVVTWPHLYPLLPEKLTNVLTEQRTQFDIAIRFCVVFLVAALVSAGLLFKHGWWILIPALCFVLSWISYRAAIVAALVYGDSYRAAFDLHRFDLLTTLHLQLPLDRDSEKSENEKLSTFLLEGGDGKFQYVHPPPKSKDR